MSLTSELEDRESPIARFFAERFSNLDDLLPAWRAKLAMAETIRPADRIAYGTVGTTIDYRIRYYFGLTPWSKLVASRGAALLRGGYGEVSTADKRNARSSSEGRWAVLIDEFARELDVALKELAPVATRLEKADEAIVCRFCYCLALFEEIYRVGPSIRSPLFDPGENAGLADFLAIASPIAVEDLTLLSWKFFDTCSDLLMEDATLNPTFDGSGDIGGADADLIVGRQLIDIKTTLNPGKLGDFRSMIYQLLGYVFLDYSDRHLLNEVAIYLARQGILVSWSLKDLLASLSGRRVNVVDERAAFRATVDEIKADYLPPSSKHFSSSANEDFTD